MALIKSKGTTLSVGIAALSAAIGQLISIEIPEMEVETTECDTLDNTNAGIPYKATGRIEGGSVSGDLFLDPSVAGQSYIVAMLTSGAANLTPAADSNTAAIVLGDGSTTFTFATAGMSLGGTVALNDAVKGKFSAKLDGIGVWS